MRYRVELITFIKLFLNPWQGVACSDGKHCCPEGHECSADCRSCTKKGETLLPSSTTTLTEAPALTVWKTVSTLLDVTVHTNKVWSSPWVHSWPSPVWPPSAPTSWDPSHIPLDTIVPRKNQFRDSISWLSWVETKPEHAVFMYHICRTNSQRNCFNSHFV